MNTCKNCKYWENTGLDDWDFCNTGKFINEQAHYAKIETDAVYHWSSKGGSPWCVTCKDFGCIHFEKRK